MFPVSCYPSRRLTISGEAAPPPEAPSNFAVGEPTDTTLNVNWDDLPGGTTARLQWQFAGGNWSALVGDQNGLTASTFQAQTLTENTAYDFRIQAESEAGVSDWVTSESQYTAPATPSGLEAVPSLYREINVTWNQAAAGQSMTVLADGSPVESGLTGNGTTITMPEPGVTYEISLVAIGNLSGLQSPSPPASSNSGVGSAPSNTTPPTQSGGAVEPIGTILTLDPGTWDGSPETVLTYDWLKNGESTGNTSIAFNTIGVNNGDLFFCRVTATNILGEASADTNTTNVIEEI